MVEIGVHKVVGRIHVRWSLDKLMNQMVIEQVCYRLDGEEMMHEERAKGGFK